MVNTGIRLIIFFAAKDGEALYSQQKQDQELIVAQIYDYITRKYEIFSKYCLESGEHTLKIVINNPHRDFALNATNMVIYDNE